MRRAFLGGTLGLFLLVILAVFAIGFVGASALERSPSFCKTCHEMVPSYDNWLESGAAKEHGNCIMCHKDPGVWGEFTVKVTAAKEVVAHFTKSYDLPITTYVADAVCLSCHSQSEVGREHDEVPRFAQQQCSQCHNHALGAAFQAEGDGEGERERAGKDEDDEKDDD